MSNNPIPSQSSEDLVINTENLDKAVNSTQSTWTDRFGNPRPTLKSLENEYGVEVGKAELAADRAETAADRAEDSVQYDYPSVENHTELLAITGMVEGQRAYVKDTEHVYRYDGSTWIDMGKGPTASKADRAVVDQITGAMSGMFSAPDSPKVPIAGTTNSAGDPVLNVWYDADQESLAVNGVAVATVAEAMSLIAATLQDVVGGMYSVPISSLIAIASTTNSAGDPVLNVWYDANARQLFVNGVALGGAPVSYADLEPVPEGFVPAEAAIMHLMTYGQSLSKGVQSIPIHSSSQPYNNLTFNAGPRATKAGSVGLNPGMTSLVPLVENTAANDEVVINIGETPCSGWANGLTRRLAIDGEDWRSSGRQFLGTANGRNSAAITQLLPGGSTAEGEWFQVLRDAISQGSALSASYGKSYSLPLWVYMQGEGDNSNNSMAGGVYGAHLATLHTAVTSYYQTTTSNIDIPWLGVYQTYARTRRERPHATIDQISYCENTPGVFHLTALYHLPLAHDGHLSTLGSFWVGEYLAKKSRQLLAGYRPQWMRLGAATIMGRVITYRPREVPVAPLRLRVDAHCRPTTDHGFLVRDDSGTAGIDSIYIGADGRSVVLVIDRDPDGDVQLRYGLDYLPAGQINYGDSAGGNLTDSDPETFTYNGVDYPLYNVCPHFQTEVIPL